MKRINIQTNKAFKLGDIDEQNGRVFVKYAVTKPVKKDGYFREHWTDPEKFKESSIRRAASASSWPLTKENRLRQIWRHAKASSSQRGHEYNMLLSDVFELWDRQQGLCAYTGWPMNFTTKSEQLVSIERIDNSIGYRPDNILLVCWCVNKARSGMSQNRFFDMCRDIAARHGSASATGAS